uniref:50S ribosomal protein L19 n=1 Tax=Zea mays TaxID=4577 RepID=B6T8M1_MAIZE|nr:50S ribosomal protein L19 [Zea mays]
MAAASAITAVSGVVLPQTFLSPRSPPPQVLAVASSFRRLSLCASPRRITHIIPRADASAEAGEPEPVTASDESEEEVAEGSVAVAEGEEPTPPSKPKVKFGEIIGILNKQFIEEAEKVKTVPDLRPGDIIELRMQRPNKRRLSLFKGIIIAKHKAGVHTTIRVRRIIAGVGVEITFPVYSPRIKEITVIRHKKVRRAKLYYLKDKLPRFSTFK